MPTKEVIWTPGTSLNGIQIMTSRRRKTPRGESATWTARVEGREYETTSVLLERVRTAPESVIELGAEAAGTFYHQTTDFIVLPGFRLQASVQRSNHFRRRESCCTRSTTESQLRRSTSMSTSPPINCVSTIYELSCKSPMGKFIRPEWERPDRKVS